jgi:GH24 family phage-related lysozyme (muramidase)
MPQPLQAVVKSYPPRGNVQQFRLEAVLSFICFRCGLKKTSKLISVYRQDWGQLLCNGCYGRVLSIYDVQAGAKPEDEKAEALGQLLVRLADAEQQKIAFARSSISANRAAWLTDHSQRFIGTAEYVAQQLGTAPSFDWSPAVIGLCKAFESELIQRVIEALRTAVAGKDLSADQTDKDFGRIAKYCAGNSPTPPEIGTIGHFLNTVAHSRTRMATSAFLQEFRLMLSRWPRSMWLIDDRGAIEQMATLTKHYRNRAAHIEELSSSDYAACFQLVVGENGMLWKLIEATTPEPR